MECEAAAVKRKNNKEEEKQEEQVAGAGVNAPVTFSLSPRGPDRQDKKQFEHATTTAQASHETACNETPAKLFRPFPGAIASV